jgi:hypothetical protein
VRERTEELGSRTYWCGEGVGFLASAPRLPRYATSSGATDMSSTKERNEGHDVIQKRTTQAAYGRRRASGGFRKKSARPGEAYVGGQGGFGRSLPGHGEVV